MNWQSEFKQQLTVVVKDYDEEESKTQQTGCLIEAVNKFLAA